MVSLSMAFRLIRPRPTPPSRPSRTYLTRCYATPALPLLRLLVSRKHPRVPLEVSLSLTRLERSFLLSLAAQLARSRLSRSWLLPAREMSQRSLLTKSQQKSPPRKPRLLMATLLRRRRMLEPLSNERREFHSSGFVYGLGILSSGDGRIVLLKS